MTHFVFATRGIYASVQQMIHDLTAQRFWWRRTNLTKGSPNEGKVEDVPVQGILRPVQLWEYIYPETSPEQPGNLDSPMIDNTQVIMKSLDLKNSEHYEPKSMQKYVRLMGKMIGLNKIPEYDDKGLHERYYNTRYVHTLGISVVPIGVKPDKKGVHDFGIAGTYDQEWI